MPPGAKKRKALKKKQQQQQQQQEAIGTSNGDNLHGGNDEHGSQDDRESDSNLNSPGSQGNQEFGGTKDPSAATVKDTAKEISEVTQGLGGSESGDNNAIAVERGTDVVETSPISCCENITLTAKNVSSQHPCVKEIAPVVGSVSKVVISEKSEHGKTSTHSKLVIEKSGEDKEYPTTGLEKENGKVGATLLESAAGTSRKVESARESEVQLPSEEKRLLLPGPPAVRTSWLSCCGLFDAMTGSDR
ncbi:hypothetical protein Bca4012_054822 [Brassica carinata]|uniref:Uncharacterized protein n=1 Tax=Brassica carinata TaxID=52824 RepID=A0A8X7VWC5_BRACI|nr:hypothetical protein Bca52824_012164 [Brassica carinata]